MPQGEHWNAPAVQQLARYEGLVRLFEDIQHVSDIGQIARRVATQWKYFANVAAWRMVLPDEEGFLVIDSFRGEATLSRVEALAPWDDHHWQLQRPSLIRLSGPPGHIPPPAFLAGAGITEIEVLPILRAEHCIALVAVAARHEPFNELDKKFVRIFGGHLADRLHGLLRSSRATRLLREREQRYRNLAENSVDWIWSLDAGGHHTYTNDRGLRLLGLSREALGKADFTALVHPDDHPRALALFRRAFETRQGWSNELLRWRLADGSYRTLESNASPVFDAGGEMIGLQGVDRDVTERIAAEIELKRHRDHLEELVVARTVEVSLAKEAAEAANRAKSTFLANMSHELRTPMSAIIGLTDLALRRATDPKLRDQLGKVARASHQLLGLINDILDLSRIEAERLTLEQTDFRLGEVIDNLTGLVAVKAAEKGLALRIDLPDGLGRLALRGDPLRLGQVLVNLTGNAVKFTPHGSVVVRGRRLETEGERVRLRFEIEDTGVGIAADDQKRLFTAFEQADASMTRRFGGTGLGLAISKRLVAMMGGEVGVTSTPGLGSTFWFTVCLGKGVAAAPVPAAGLSAEARLRGEHAGARILVVEDEPLNRLVAGGLLEAAGLAVDMAEDGQQAVEMVPAGRYDLILMDMQLPVLNGLDATRAIRRLPDGAVVPIVAMTANAFSEDRAACLAAGMNDHIAKPIDPDRLFEVLLDWLAPRR